MNDEPRNVVATGPSFSGHAYRSEDECNVAFRILMDYHIGTDSNIVRLDMKVGGVQFNTGFHVRRVPDSAQIGGDALVLPQRFAGLNFFAHETDLIETLRGMADRLEQQLKDNVGRMKP